MAKKKEIKSFQNRFDRDETKHRRVVGTRNKRVYFLIVCEGTKTEPNYFSSFEHNLPPYTLDIETQGKGLDPLGVVEAAIELKRQSSKPLSRVWVVFDRDDFQPVRFHMAIEKAEANGIQCAWSNEAFEFWYFLHFQYRDVPMSRDDYQKCIEKEINKRMQEKNGKSGKTKKYTYRKNAEDMHFLLTTYGNEEQAIRWAEKLINFHEGKKQVDCNPCTTVHRLVQELNHPECCCESPRNS